MAKLPDNEWLRATLVIACATPLLLACLTVSHRFHPDDASLSSEPIRALAILLPGLVAGWFTRRHPLLVGAAIGLLAAVIAALAGADRTPLSWPGHAIALALYVAVAALAGRALRFRFAGSIPALTANPGRRAMDFLVNIDVDDIDAATRFYVDAFDLRLGRRIGAAAVELLDGPAPIYLLAKAAGTQAATTTAQERTYARHWTPVHLDFVVADIDAAVVKAVAAGATQERPVATQAWGKLALMADPFGHGFCFVQFTGRGYDAIAGG